MQYNFVLIRTDKGGRYANKILKSIEWINENKYPQHEFFTYNMTIGDFLNSGGGVEINWNKLSPKNTIIHARCANPRTKWTIKLRELEEMGYKVVNSVDCIELTSNKLACSLHLQGKVNHPKSWEYRKDGKSEEYGNFHGLLKNIQEELGYPEYIIAKPLTSLEQGANVNKINLRTIKNVGYEQVVRNEFNKVPGNKIVIQEYIPYIALHRVIVINGKALPYTFIDRVEFHKPGDWKVSCCLNRTTMKLNENADLELLELAEKTQKEVGGVINFIDIFEYPIIHPDLGQVDIGYTNAEINTACSLNIHEKLAKDAGRPDWNIHSKIAQELVKQIL